MLRQPFGKDVKGMLRKHRLDVEDMSVAVMRTVFTSSSLRWVQNYDSPMGLLNAWHTLPATILFRDGLAATPRRYCREALSGLFSVAASCAQD